ncbi:MAG: hypothetical protein M9939_18845 [Mesorhizobium sp.]|nr:hypothetical protein [Mesorhizobium sp.]MCO5163197.1 hypothetical protein [Mesorhizobium sp.]
MFEKITIRSVAGPDQNLDPGTLAEVLLFYGKTHLVLDFGRLIALIKAIGAANIEFLIDNGFVDITYILSQTGVATNKLGPLEIHGLVQFQVNGREAKKRVSAESQIELAVRRSQVSEPASRRLLKKLMHAAEVKDSFERLIGSERNISEIAIDLLDDRKLLTDLMNECLGGLLYWTNVPIGRFSLHRDKDGFIIDTDMRIDQLNKVYSEKVPPSHSSITRAYLLTFIWDSILDLHLASHYGSELLTGSIQERLIGVRIGSMLSRVKKDRTEINEFSDFVFADGKSVRGAINSGQRSFDDIRDILIKAQKFRRWLDGINPDKSLIKAYHQEVTAETWIDRLPGKSSRFALFTGAGFLADLVLTGGFATAGGVGLGLLDTYLLDGMIKGWKPNQFVDAELQNFVASN